MEVYIRKGADMKEAFEKIKERLEERRKLHADLSQSDSITEEEQIIQSRFCGCFCRAKEIVNQVAEEYDNDFCEWESDFNWFSGKCKYETSCGYTFYELKHAEPFKVCPYCGKKIKVVE